MTTSRLMGVDVGTVRIGLALSDSERIVATPMATIDGRDHLRAIDEIGALIATHQVRTLVIGLPFDLDGTEGRAAKRTRRFVRRLQSRLDVEVEWIDERLTSAQAERALYAADYNRRQRKKVVDQVAASLILQAWLDGARG